MYPVGVHLTMTSVGFAKRNYEMMHETFDAELEVEVTDNTWLTVCADILTDGYICYETMHDVLPINQYHTDLQKEIDDAEWLGDFERADSVKIELEHIKHMIDNGELWYPTF